MRIAVVTQYYAPEDARIPTTVARELSRRGHEVCVVTAFPSYPLGRIYDGYRQRFGHTEWDGAVRVRRVRSILAHSPNPVTRMMNYLSFALSSAFARKEARSADVVYVYATQMTAAFGPVFWRILGGAPYLLHVQDLWPESVTQSSLVRQGLLARVMAAVMTPFLRFAYRRAAGIVAIAPTMKEVLLQRGANEMKTIVVLNWADETSLPTSSIPAARTHQTHIVYAGNIGPMQELEVAVAAAAKVADLEGFKLTIVGSGLAEESLHEAVKASGANNVRIEGRIPKELMGELYLQSDFQLITLKDLPIFRGTVPSKFSASLEAGIPVITNVAGDVASMVSAQRLGLSCAPGSVDALATAFRAAHNMSTQERKRTRERCRRFYLDSMSKDRGMDLIESALQLAASS